MKETKYVHQLSKKFTSKNTKWIDANIINPDELTLTIFTASTVEGIDNLTRLLRMVKGRGYQSPVELENSTTQISVEELTKLAQGQVSDDVLAELAKFSTKTPLINCAGKSILSVLWANTISNSIARKTNNNDELIHLFFAVVKCLEKEVTIDELHDEVFGIFENERTIIDYFNLVNIDIQNGNEWFDFSSYPPAVLGREMNYDLQISSNDELLESLKDFKNLPSAIAYVKNTYLQETDVKKDGYCKDDLIRDYKALAIILKVLDDKKFKDDPNFDLDKNIGFNLSAKLYATEELIKQTYINYKNSEVFAGFKNQSKKLAADVLGNAPRKANDYKVWLGTLNKYIAKCKIILRKLDINTVEVYRDYLKILGLIKDNQRISSVSNIDIEIMKKSLIQKINSARTLKEDYIKSGNIDDISNDPLITEAEELEKELLDWNKNAIVKNPLQVKSVEKYPILKEYVLISKTRPDAKKAQQPAPKTQTPVSSNGATQLTIDLDDTVNEND